ncbi:hypothetical protein BV22DRAFT_1016233 [Leucogyrophana mollusca]|uniref:Uncharacterized protein n=1 Tax=Leucogyrophana mollusca TaxID=85980 RepID=A0ACB8BAY3_9AGAM|nr:hypothetical protein BV22DRAFT_1016233 [Leucogyrophana mollusca]
MATPSTSIQYAFSIAFYGSNLASLFYGVFAVISLSNLYTLQKKGGYMLLLGYLAALLTATTIYTGFAIHYGSSQLLELVTESDDGVLHALSIWPEIVIDSAFVVNTWLADLFILYRCYIIWTGNRMVVVWPFLLYIATIGTSVVLLWESCHPQSFQNSSVVLSLIIPYWACSVAQNVVSSLLIAARLLHYRRRLHKALGSHTGHPYLTMIAMTVESAALYTLFGIITLVLYSLGNTTESIFVPILGMMQVIAPNLIIHRIAQGISFNSTDYQNEVISDIRFAPEHPSATSDKLTGPLFHGDGGQVARDLCFPDGNTQSSLGYGSASNHDATLDTA